MELDPSNPHTIWSGVLSFAGVVLAFTTNRLYKDVDGKADKEATKQRFEAQEKAISDLFDRQDEQHKANTERLDRIYSAIASRNGP